MDKVREMANDLSRYILLIAFEITDKTWNENQHLKSAHEKIQSAVILVQESIFNTPRQLK